ncbi:hypothetical protein [Actinomadura sp. DC4]|uniref:hypothetical protein n=1 Tax=Actinomadura sp. DC4 TaxID=3055069 RepID=UPI0025AEE7BC|nr:hypothetical protein [Actinomadura sp. DC4]MDN3354880.1 hypothetical protein [Actinomadura sp. DC4]
MTDESVSGAAAPEEDASPLLAAYARSGWRPGAARTAERTVAGISRRYEGMVGRPVDAATWPATLRGRVGRRVPGRPAEPALPGRPAGSAPSGTEAVPGATDPVSPGGVAGLAPPGMADGVAPAGTAADLGSPGTSADTASPGHRPTASGAWAGSPIPASPLAGSPVSGATAAPDAGGELGDAASGAAMSRTGLPSAGVGTVRAVPVVSPVATAAGPDVYAGAGSVEVGRPGAEKPGGSGTAGAGMAGDSGSGGAGMAGGSEMGGTWTAGAQAGGAGIGGARAAGVEAGGAGAGGGGMGGAEAAGAARREARGGRAGAVPAAGPLSAASPLPVVSPLSAPGPPPAAGPPAGWSAAASQAGGTADLLGTLFDAVTTPREMPAFTLRAADEPQAARRRPEPPGPVPPDAHEPPAGTAAGRHGTAPATDDRRSPADVPRPGLRASEVRRIADQVGEMLLRRQEIERERNGG